MNISVDRAGRVSTFTVADYSPVEGLPQTYSFEPGIDVNVAVKTAPSGASTYELELPAWVVETQWNLAAVNITLAYWYEDPFAGGELLTFARLDPNERRPDESIPQPIMIPFLGITLAVLLWRRTRA